MKILKLTVKKKWFDMIASGEKTEEYRDIKEYWCRRLMTSNADGCHDDFSMKEIIYDLNHPYERHDGVDYLMGYFLFKFKSFDAVKFTNGYKHDSPLVICKLNKITIATGKSEWGADPEKFYFVLKYITLLAHSFLFHIADMYAQEPFFAYI